MAYSKNSWSDGTTPVDAERLNHLEDGVNGAVEDIDSLTARFSPNTRSTIYGFYLSDSSASDHISIIQNEWANLSVGILIGIVNRNTDQVAIIQKNSDNYGSVILFGYNNTPVFYRKTAGSWLAGIAMT